MFYKIMAQWHNGTMAQRNYKYDNALFQPQPLPQTGRHLRL